MENSDQHILQNVSLCILNYRSKVWAQYVFCNEYYVYSTRRQKWQ